MFSLKGIKDPRFIFQLDHRLAAVIIKQSIQGICIVGRITDKNADPNPGVSKGAMFPPH